jgi:hypothetical protein
MRMMLKAVVDTAAGNAVIADGSISQVIGRLVEELHPEATYFAAEDGQRACFMVFDMTDAATLPSISEPLFQATNARVTVTPIVPNDERIPALVGLIVVGLALALFTAPRSPRANEMAAPIEPRGDQLVPS